jgi:hypothetical protein
MIDALRELRIRFYLRLMILGDEVRKYACAKSTALIRSRSPERIQRMEKERGLA